MGNDFFLSRLNKVCLATCTTMIPAVSSAHQVIAYISVKTITSDFFHCTQQHQTIEQGPTVDAFLQAGVLVFCWVKRIILDEIICLAAFSIVRFC